MKALFLFAILACACCNDARADCGGCKVAAVAERPAPIEITPGPEAEIKPGADYYVMTPEQLAQLKAAIAKLADIIHGQQDEIARLTAAALLKTCP